MISHLSSRGFRHALPEEIRQAMRMLERSLPYFGLCWVSWSVIHDRSDGRKTKGASHGIRPFHVSLCTVADVVRSKAPSYISLNLLNFVDLAGSPHASPSLGLRNSQSCIIRCQFSSRIVEDRQGLLGAVQHRREQGSRAY